MAHEKVTKKKEKNERNGERETETVSESVYRTRPLWIACLRRGEQQVRSGLVWSGLFSDVLLVSNRDRTERRVERKDEGGWVQADRQTGQRNGWTDMI